MVWQKTRDGKEIPVWSMFTGGTWCDPQALSVREGANGWYPDISVIDDDSVLVAWSSRGDDFATIETATIGYDHVPCDLVISNTQISNNSTYQAGATITVGPSVVVTSPAVVEFRAGSSVTFKPGFSANRGSVISAFTDNKLECNN